MVSFDGQVLGNEVDAAEGELVEGDVEVEAARSLRHHTCRANPKGTITI